MRIAVVGAGGVGGYFGAKLARAGESVVMLARGPHLDAIRRDGIRVRSALEGDSVAKVEAVESFAGQPRRHGAVLRQVVRHASAAEAAADRAGPSTGVVSSKRRRQRGDARSVLAPARRWRRRLRLRDHRGAGPHRHKFAGRIVFGNGRRITERRRVCATRSREPGAGGALGRHPSPALEKYLLISAQAA